MPIWKHLWRTSADSRVDMIIPVYGTVRRRMAMSFRKSASLTFHGVVAVKSVPAAGSRRGTLMVCGPQPKRSSR